MSSTYTTSLGIEKPTTGEQAGTWGDTVNNNAALIEQAISGWELVAIDDSATPTTITIPDGATGKARNMIVELSGAITAERTLIVPDKKKLYFIHNGTTGGFSVIVKTSGGAGITVPHGTKVALACYGAGGVTTLTNYMYGNIDGNAATVTNGVYTTTPYTDPSWIGSLAATKLTGSISETNLPTISIAKGGTAADSPANARTNLNVPSRTGEGATGSWNITATSAANATYATSAGSAASVSGVVGIPNGGTGSSSGGAFLHYGSGSRAVVTYSTGDPGEGSAGDVHFKHEA